MHVLERIAIENLAIKLFDHYNSTIGNIYSWKGISVQTRDTWRAKAEELINEKYYTDGS